MTNFIKWFNESFLKRNGGWSPKNLEQWINSINEQHTAIRNLIKGDLIQKFYKISDAARPLTKEEYAGELEKLNEIIPNFFQNVVGELTPECLALPYYAQGSHKFIKISKHISKCLSHYLTLTGDRGGTKNREVQAILASLGEKWSRAKLEAEDIEITLSTTPKAFVLLGHYGPDHDSCFRQGSTSPKDKYVFGQSSETFVITISRKVDEKFVNVSRALGFFAPSLNQFGILNYYCDPTFNPGNGTEAIRRLFSDLTESEILIHPSEEYPVVSGECGDWNFYQNPSGRHIFHQKGTKPSALLLYANVNKILLQICERCGEGIKPRRGERPYTCDGMEVCINCADEAYRSEFTGNLTFSELVPVIDDRQNTLMASAIEVERLPNCQKCSNKMATSIEVDGKIVCSHCFAEFYNHCDECQKIILEENLHDLGDIDVCESCINKWSNQNDI